MNFFTATHIWRRKLLRFPIVLFLTALITTFFMGYPHPLFSQPLLPEIRGVWVTTNDTEVIVDRTKTKEALAQLKKLNFNTIYPVVWNSGYILYPSTLAQKEGIQTFVPKGNQGQDALGEFIAEAHAQKLLVLPWFEFGFMAPQTSELVLNHPNWVTQKRDGTKTWEGAAGEVVWLNPFHPEVQRFILDMVAEVMNKYDVDGIQFDDHLSLPREFGYDRYTVSLYKQETKKDPPANFKDPEWMRWRADKITDFVGRLRQVVKNKKPNALLSISPNPYEFAYNTSVQDWLTWVRKDLVDELVVQVYRNDIQSFEQQLARWEIQEARQKIPTGVGILAGLRNRPIPMSFIQSKVYSARKYGLGISFFFYESLWDYAPETSQERKSFFAYLFSLPSPRDLEPIPTTPSTIDPIDPSPILEIPVIDNTSQVPKPIQN